MYSFSRIYGVTYTLIICESFVVISHIMLMWFEQILRSLIGDSPNER